MFYCRLITPLYPLAKINAIVLTSDMQHVGTASVLSRNMQYVGTAIVRTCMFVPV